MSDVSGIPNMGFGGGGYFGGIPNVSPAMSAAQINQGIWGRYSPGQAQATLNNIYGPGGFGAMPAYYAALGAAYGRQVQPARAAAPAYDPYAGLRDRIAQAQQAAAARQAQAPARPAANPYAAWYGGLPGGAQAYNSWNMGLPAQGGFGVPGAIPQRQQPDFSALYQNRTFGLPNASNPNPWLSGHGLAPGYTPPPPQPAPGPQSSAGQNWYGMPTATS
jgi:hypothetical protein